MERKDILPAVYTLL